MNKFSNKKYIILIISSCLFILSGCGGCGTKEIASFPSIDKSNKAVIYQFDCGATTGYSTHVAVLPIDDELEKDPFSADSIKGVVFRTNNAYLSTENKPLKLYINVNWLDNKHLQISYPENLEVYRSDKNLNDIAISYKTYKADITF